MFNVTLLTDEENDKAINYKSDTFHPYLMDYKYSIFSRPLENPPFDK